MTAPNAAEVLNLVGFVTGTALYAMLLALVLRRPTDGSGALGRPDRLPLATALLGLAWNLGELASYGLPRLGLAPDTVGLSAMSFPALGLLAAVVVHSVSRGLPHSRVITGFAYTASIAAALLHIATIVTNNPSTSTIAFQILTVCFGLLIVLLGVLTRAQANGRRALWVLALALFAVSASHLGSFHASDDSWWMQLAGHHAAIPLAFAILYQDYRFALGDLFLKRALALIALVILAVAGYSFAIALPAGPSAVGTLIGLWVATALVAPWLQHRIVSFVDTVLLGRTDFAALQADMREVVQEQATIHEVLDAACRHLATAFNARRVWWTEVPERSTGATDGGEKATLVSAEVPTTDPPRYAVQVAALTGGRRLLSDDLALLEAALDMCARRIDAIRLTTERYDARLREEEMQKLAAEAELMALRAQINPHFLFNALTTIGYLIESAPSRALDTLMRLTGLLRGVLRSDGEFTTLGRELEIVEHYLDIERERFEERLRVRVDVPLALRACRIPLLVVQPLVENAVKHGVAPSTRGGDVTIVAQPDAADRTRLRITVRNTGAPLTLRTAVHDERVGLENVRRRLAGYYGDRATLTLRSEPDGATLAEIILPLEAQAAHSEEQHGEIAARSAGRR